MRRGCYAFFLLLWLGLAATQTARATTIIVTLDSNFPGDYNYYAYTDVNGTPQAAVPTGPYPATFSGGTLIGTPAVFLFCYDFNVDTSVGTAYSGFLTVPTTQADIEAAYLENLVLQAGGTGADVNTVSGPISMAIWFLENPSSVKPAPFPVDQTTAALVAQAQTAYLNGSWTAAMAANFPIWIPDNLPSSQRFGVLLGPPFGPGDVDPPAPEPGSAGLIGIGGLLLLVSKKLRWIRN